MDNAGFILAAYLATTVVLVVYALSVHGRLRRARDRHDPSRRTTSAE